MGRSQGQQGHRKLHYMYIYNNHGDIDDLT
jgi:hypothetical protein